MTEQEATSPAAGLREPEKPVVASRTALPEHPKQPSNGQQKEPAPRSKPSPRLKRPAHAQAAHSRYVPAIDGLRAFAVLAVICYHLGLDWAPGGLMGVTVFFVISGYLINGLLVAEHERTGTISLPQFWLRRVRRIIPAVLLAVAGTVALCALISPALLEKARPDILPSLLFYNNWWQILHDVSYFEAAGAPSPLTHFWSLAIEEQFYIVWPFVLLLLFRCKLGKKPIAAIIALLAIASAVEMALLYDPLGDPSRVYYGTDTRAMSLLAGALLALIWPSAAFGPKVEKAHVRVLAGGRLHVREPEHLAKPTRELHGAKRFFLNLGGVVALVGLVAIMCFTNGFSAFPYYGGIALTTVLSALLIAAVVVPNSWVARLMQLSPLVWIGKRSYGMYLWHFPIILLTSKIGWPIEIPWWVHIAQIVVIFAISDLSYRFVENPIRKGDLSAWYYAHTLHEPVPTKTRARRIITTIVVAAICAGAAAGLIIVQPPTEISKAKGVVAALTAQARPRVKQEIAAEKRRQEEQREKERKQAAKNAYENLFMTQHANAAGEPIFEPLLVGDSVPAGALGEFYETFPYGYADAVVGRNIWESTYEDYLKSNQVGTYVVFCLGTNGAVDDAQIDELLSKVTDDKKVILVNTRSTYFDWDDVTNAALARAPERHPNIVAVADWYSASENHPEYFIYDGTHLLPEGAVAYISLIDETIRKSLEAQ